MSIKSALSTTGRWLAAALVGLFGLALLASTVIGGFLVLLSAAAISPPLAKRIPNPRARSAIQVGLLIGGIAFLFIHINQEAAQHEAARAAAEAKAEAERKQRLEAAEAARKQRLETQRPAIVAAVKSALEQQDWRGALEQGGAYADWDEEIADMVAQAQQRLQEQKWLQEIDALADTAHEERAKRYRQLAELAPDNPDYRAALTQAEAAIEAARLAAVEKRIQEILSELKTVPATEYAKNEHLYKTLTELAPDEPRYREKLTHYAALREEQETKEREEKVKRRQEKQRRLALFGEKPTQSAWDGSYLAVNRYLKQIAHDPDSIDIINCTDVYFTDDGWLVGCDYRGKNAFGATIKQSNWFTIRHGDVVKKHAPSAYSAK